MFMGELTFAVIAFTLVVPATVFLSTTDVLAVAADSRFESAADCKGGVSWASTVTLTCCWREPVPGKIVGEVYCQTCLVNEDGTTGDCDPKELQMRQLPEGDLPQLETVPPNRTLLSGVNVSDLPTLQPQGEPPLPVVCSEEAGLEKDPETGQCVPIGPGGGGIPTLEQVPPNTTFPGGGDIPILETGPGFTQGTEGEPPLPVVCSEEAGLEKDPETGQCVPIEPVAPEPSEELQEQPSDEGEEQPDDGGGDGSSEDSGNSNDGGN
jgi:hypothetical protein